MRQVISSLNSLVGVGIIDAYAIGGAVAATFYLEPVATVDIDVFVAMRPLPGSLLLDPSPIFKNLADQGFATDGEYVIIAGWPVQILAPTGPLVDEALVEAVSVEIDGELARVFSPEHLAAICLETGRAKDKARLLRFCEEGQLDFGKFQSIVGRFNLGERWESFSMEFLKDRNDI